MKFVRILYGTLFLLTIIWRTTYAQNSVVEQSNTVGKIEWVSELPLESDEKKTFLNKIGDILFGKSEVDLSRPISIYPVEANHIIILDQDRGQLVEVEGSKVQELRIRGERGRRFESLVSVCKLPTGELLFTDSYQDKIFKLNRDKRRLITLNESLILEQPTGIAYSKENKEIWVLETRAHRIAILNQDGKLKKRMGSRGTGEGEFNFPTHIWIDKDGKILVLDAMNFRVQIFDAKGNFESSFGQQGDVSGSFAMPKGIATDSYNNIYVADALFHTVQIFDRQGNYLYNFGTQGTSRSEFWMPLGIYIDDDDRIYVADTYNSRVQVFKVNMETR